MATVYREASCSANDTDVTTEHQPLSALRAKGWSGVPSSPGVLLVVLPTNRTRPLTGGRIVRHAAITAATRAGRESVLLPSLGFKAERAGVFRNSTLDLIRRTLWKI
jgi:hypothetical protein